MLASSARDIWTALFLFTPCWFIIPISTLASAQPVSGDSVFSSRGGRLDSQDDSSQLPIQIGGIVASYVIFDAVVVFLILFIGRRLRREAHSSNYSLEMVMLGPAHKYAGSLDPSPISDYTIDSQFPSPDKPRGWNMSWPSVKSHKAHASMNSSVATIDASVVSADRRRAQEEMEFLYAQVLEHDAKKASPQSSPVMDKQSSPDTPLASPVASIQPPPYQLQPQYQEPLSPRQGSTATNKSRTSKRLSKLSNLSIFSPSSRSSTGSNKLKSPHSIRDLPISPPVKTPDPVQTATYQDSQPMSPRIYNPGPPPTAPLQNSARGFTLQPLATPNSVITTRAHAAPPPLSINSSNSTLPFRQQFNPPQSAPYTKTTILERPFNNVSGGPRTGMPTPYSPYMPFTPLTPITPSRLVTKRDRKKMSRSNGLKVLHEDDLVKNDEELWGM
ncbi:hypothetical protein UA08_05373 [Talaromyces atroroseus]|uniref:Uncharacterized protein n=1 Tax=Talaromyces atroroseus TaxID=1441469 RepID=A0A225AXX2_TALAT|nr:hypothetical protein UA08_05373 [Talaromyces atroroseus]OKL59305.1 hypothetical protein UA08_05373 [Talaromyces atroroseus]